MKRKIFLLALIWLASANPASVIRTYGQEPLDGRNRILRDDFLDNLVGEWSLSRKFRGQTTESSAKAEWVLNHQFLLIHMKDAGSSQPYEAMVFIGYDNTSERYVAHWIDVFGGRFSETLGYGNRSGNVIKFVFEYPDGPFHNTFTWNPENKSLVSLMEQKDSAGNWKVFGVDTLRRTAH